MSVGRWALGVALLGIVPAALLGASQGKHWLALDGGDWGGMSAREQAAWTQGFLAGRAVGQVADSVSRDTLALARALEELRRNGLVFPYATPLYSNRMNDFYFWENHRALPLWRAMQDVNRELRGREKREGE